MLEREKLEGKKFWQEQARVPSLKGLLVDALIEEGPDRRDIGREVNIVTRRIDERPLQRSHASQRVHRTRYGNFIARFLPLAISPIA
jgi:hypothetical protein